MPIIVQTGIWFLVAALTFAYIKFSRFGKDVFQYNLRTEGTSDDVITIFAILFAVGWPLWWLVMFPIAKVIGPHDQKWFDCRKKLLAKLRVKYGRKPQRNFDRFNDYDEAKDYFVKHELCKYYGKSTDFWFGVWLFEQVTQENQNKTSDGVRRTNICVIDDSCMIRSTLSQCLKDNADCAVVEYSRIPEDESELAQYDVLIVDGQGISNSKYSHGMEFCKTYQKRGNNKLLIYHSGLGAYGEDKEALEKKGVKIIEKGENPQHIIDAVKGATNAN